MKRLMRRLASDTQTIKEHKHLRVFGRLVYDPNLWHFNRRSAAGAFAIGFFMMRMPPLPLVTRLQLRDPDLGSTGIMWQPHIVIGSMGYVNSPATQRDAGRVVAGISQISMRNPAAGAVPNRKRAA